MFSEMVKYKFLCMLRSKDSIFWLLLFPIILSILFQAALGDILKGETFETVSVAVVENDEYQAEQVMPSLISSVSAKTEESATEDTLFITTYTSTAKEAEQLLTDEKIAGYIYVQDGEFHLKINENGVGQTIIKTFLDIAIQKEKMVVDIMTENQGVMPENLTQLMSESVDYVKDVSNRENEPDTLVVYFYSILGMACMYGAATGCTSISNILTGQSAVAKRNNVASVSRMKQLLSSLLVDLVMSDAIILLILAFIHFVLGVNFGSRYGWIILTSLIGATTGLSFGYLLGSISNKSLNFKSNLVVAISMICSFLAGMMGNQVKYYVQQHAYLVDRLNPVNLITESYYKLYYYTSLKPYMENILILCALTVVFTVVTIFVLQHKTNGISKERS
ncbi:MAG: ABC transporter permease [Lachnospiraceae bacterium]|nr:ABC transporter permease [Lachnospiraceae bacterium]